MKRRYIFISYSWDSDVHKAWVKKFSDDLQTGLGAEYEVLLDQNQPKGTDFGLFMQRGITMAEKVMIIGTTKYKEKSQKRLDGGVAYEGSIIREEKIANIATTKFYTILREGTFQTSFPPGLGNTFGDDLSNDEKYDELLPTIVEEIKNPKTISSIFKLDENDKININNPEIKLEQAKLLKNNIERTKDVLIITIGDISFKMIRVEGGTFMMGATNEQQSSRTSKDEYPVRQVTLSPFYIGETEVTQELWDVMMSSNPSSFYGPDRPVENVSWNDCKEFIEKLNARTKMKFRLPTEAEWEFAARGGIKSKCFLYSGSNTLEDVAWFEHNSGNKTHAVAQKEPNELGLYDMSGNVWEWCGDSYDEKYYFKSPLLNPLCIKEVRHRVVRGGNWSSIARFCRVAFRNSYDSRFRDYGIGLRLAFFE